MSDRIVVESEKTGIQAELILRKHSELDPDRTHETAPSKALAKKLQESILKILDSAAKDD